MCIETILSSSSTRWSSVRRYVERNMEPLENYPQLKEIVQDEIAEKFLDAFSETRGNVHIINWDELPLILSSQIVDSLNRYTKRNMERHEIENNPQLKKLVQAEIGKQLDVAIRDGTLQSKKWDGTLVSHLGYKNWDNERLIYSEREPDHEELNDGLITNDLGTCIICLHNQRTTAFGPCGHICACLSCGGEFLWRKIIVHFVKNMQRILRNISLMTLTDREELNDGLITNDLGTCITCIHDQRTTAFGPCGHNAHVYLVVESFSGDKIIVHFVKNMQRIL